MYFRQVLHPEKACASYMIGCPTRGVCAVIDPQGDPQVYVSQVEQNGMALRSIIDTHTHADHVSCARDLAALTGVPLYVGPGASVRFPHRTLPDGHILEVGN
ncbi:MAG: MBL fold metallo-hydrolase, partial [Bacillati bacterium ANGP1]